MSVNSICKQILRVTDDEIAELEVVAKNQTEFFSPLRMATAAWQAELGRHNTAVLKQFKALRKTLQKGAGIRKP